MAEGDVQLRPLDIDDTVKLLLKNDEEVRNSSDMGTSSDEQNSSNHRSGSIFMVPTIYRALSPASFTPRVVSIGPLHHQDEHLKGFEVQKATYMHNLLHKVLSPYLDSTPEQILKECVVKISGSIDQIKACYVGMQTYPDSELVKMMVTDACFILAYLHNPFIYYSSLGTIELLHTHICFDLVLIENQIPFFVLEDIFECTILKLHLAPPLAIYISRILDRCNIFERDLEMSDCCISSTDDHILGVLHKSYHNPDRDSSRTEESVKSHSVVELDRSGVKFSARRDTKWLMAMEVKYSRFLCFPLSWSKPTLEMPVLNIDDSTELVIRNLFMYEHSYEVQTCITSYMHALDELIDTPEDVAKLVKSQVLVNRLGSHEKAANLINDMLKEVVIKDFYYQAEWKQMDKYYTARWPKLMAESRRKYFSNPWSIIALLAGMVLFVLTVVQTVYGVKSA